MSKMEFGANMGKQLRYDGMVEPKEFLKAFSLQALMYKWDATTQATAITLMLTGKAERVFESMSGDKTDIDEIKKALQEGCTETKEVLLHKFYATKPKENELLSAYAVRLQNLLEKAMPDLKGPELSIMLRGQLATHLPDYMRALITFNQKTTWDELLTALDAAHPYVNKMSLDTQVKTEFVDANVMSTGFRDERRCHICNESGHLKRSCPKRKQRNDKQGYKQYNSYNANNNFRSRQQSGDNARSSNQNFRRTNNGGEYNSRNLNKNNQMCKRRGNQDVDCGESQTAAYTLNVNKEDSCDDDVCGFGNLSLNTIEWKEEPLHKVRDRNSRVYSKEQETSKLFLDVNALITKVPLLRRSIKFSLANGSQSCKLRALFDGGASNSFVRLSSLPAQLQKAIQIFKRGQDTVNEFHLAKETLTICGATGSVTECCTIALANLVIGEWNGKHRVVITENLVDKDLILGRDFMKKYNVVINHGTDEIRIDKVEESGKLSDPMCYVVESREILPHTENIIKCRTNFIPAGKQVLLEPCNTIENAYWSNCVSTINDEGDFYVKLINVGSEVAKIDAGSRIGNITENFEKIKDSETYELKTVNMSQNNRQVIEDVKAKLSRLKFGKKLTSEQVEKVKSVVQRNMAAFQWSEDDVGRTNLIEHEINTGNNKPIKQKQFKIPQAVQGVLDTQIKEMVKNNLIEPSTSAWCSPMMIIKQKKRDGSFKYRFVCDMKGVNSVTEKDSFPLQRMDQALDQLGGAKYFSVIDMSRGYFQVPLSKKDRHKTAFTANGKLWQWKVMCLGLCNAPSTFTRLMDLVLNGLTFMYCLVYLDDTIVYSKSFDEHLLHLEEIFSRLIKAGLKLNPDKCVFASDEVNYLGFIVSTEGITPDPDKVKAINDIKFPRNPKEMLRFLGAANFYRDFIHKFSNIASPLYKMAQSKQKFKEKLKTKVAFEAFQKLKLCLMSTPVLTYPNWKLDFFVQTDASGYAIGGVIGQYIENKFKPIMYAGRHLTAAETRYSTTERELLAVVFCHKKFKAYLYGRRCTFIVDHEPLVTMRKLKDPMGRIGNLLNKIQDCDYDMVYQPGALHFTPDLLSRPSKNVVINSIEMQFGSCINWVQEQAVDVSVSEVIRLVKNKNDDEYNSVVNWLKFPKGAEWFKIREELSLEHDILVKLDIKPKIVIPKQSISVVLNFMHDAPLAGHRDFEKTYEAIREKYFWVQMHKDVKKYCETCHLCQTKKYLNKLSVAPLKPIVVNTVWGLIGLDIAGPLKVTPSGNKYIVIAVDYFTKFCIAKAIPDFTALTTAKFVFEEIICKMGMPKSIISDKGVNFQSNLFEQLCKMLKVKKANATFYHPQGVGQVERMVKIIKQILTMYVDDTHTNWDEFLQSSISAYNTSCQASLKLTPYEALYARQAIKLSDVLLDSPVNFEENQNLDQYVTGLKQKASVIHKRINENLLKAHDVQKKYYDRQMKNTRVYAVGDLVSVVNERSIVGQSHAFKDRALGPYKILSIFNDKLNYQIVNLQDNKVNKIHYNRLLPYRSRDGTGFSSSKQSVIPSSVSVEKEIQEYANVFDFEVDVDFIMASLVHEVPLGTKFECEFCLVDFGSKRKLLQHRNEFHAGEFTVADSVFEVATRELISSVEYEEVGDVISTSSFVCELCELTCKSKSSLNKHMRVIHDEERLKHVTDVIDSVIAASEKAYGSESSVNSECNSDENDTTSSSEGSLAEEPKVKRSKYVNCDICGKKVKSRGLHVHKRIHSKIVEESSISSSVERM